MWALNHMYTTRALKYQVADIKQAIGRGDEQKLKGVVLIVMRMDADHQIEFFKASELTKTYYPMRDWLLIGLAQSIGRARELLVEMTDDALRQTGDAGLRTFFARMWDDGDVREIL